MYWSRTGRATNANTAKPVSNTIIDFRLRRNSSKGLNELFFGLLLDLFLGLLLDLLLVLFIFPDNFYEVFCRILKTDKNVQNAEYPTKFTRRLVSDRR